MSNKLILTKTHDKCAEQEPKLTVVLIHGIASDSRTFDSLLEYLESLKSMQGVRFVTFDLLGSGKSLKDDSLNYDYEEQVEALHNSIIGLKSKTPLVLVGHSLGTFIVTKYVDTYKKDVSELILVSPPIYTPEDLKNPAFMMGIEMFKGTVALKNPRILKEKAFNNSMEKIVLNPKNYKTLAGIKSPITLIYGNDDQLIAPYNMPKFKKESVAKVEIHETNGRHGVTKDKFEIIKNTILKKLKEQNETL